MIEVKSISKRFEESEVLTEINAHFQKGKTNLIIGQSGSGKSTILSLIPRIYDPKSGVIEIDGQNIKDVNLFSLRK